MLSVRPALACMLLCGAATAQLAGLYTINATQPTGGGNFQTIGAALNVLHTQTLQGPVTFQLFDDGGPWTEVNAVATSIMFGTGVLPVQGHMVSGSSATNTVTFEAAPGEFPVLDATGQAFGVHLHGTQYTTVKGLEIMNAGTDGVSIYTDSVSTPSGSTTSNLFGNQVYGCRIHDIGGCGINVYQNGGAGIAFEGTIIRNNFIWRCQVTHGGVNSTWRNGYINERRAIRAIIENNTLFGDTGVGTNFGLYVTWYAAPIGGPAASFRNNLLVKTVTNGAVIRHIEANSMPLVQDYNAYDDQSSGNMFLAGASGSAATFAAFQAAYPTKDPNGAAGASMLLNGPAGDLHVGPGSVAIDMGTPIAGVPDDIDGQLRPIGSGYDAGADEAGSQSPQVNLYGSGCPGANGTPTLGSTQLPSLGNPLFTIDVGSAPGGAAVYLFAALGRQVPPAPIGGNCFVHLELVSLQALIAAGFGPFGPQMAGGSGGTTFAFSIPNDPGLAGALITFQAAIADATSAPGFTVSNGLEAILN